MKKTLIFAIAVLLLLPGLLFAEPEKEKADTTTTVDQMKGSGNIQYFANIQEFEKQTGKTMPAFVDSPYIKANMGISVPVNDRVPSEPLVLWPSDETGKYGSALRDPYAGAHGFMEDLLREFPLMYSTDMKDIVPNIFQSWEVSSDVKTFTFKLRKGMKWSDGEPFTTADLMYWYESMALNKEIYPGGVTNMKIRGEMGKWTALDDYTLKMAFIAPYGVVIERLCRWRPMPYAPAHFMKDFHPDFTSKADLDARVKAGGFNSWIDLHSEMYYWHNNPETPTLFAWKVLNKDSQPVHQLERNAYYWKVDVAGQQLPYFDRVHRRNLGGEAAKDQLTLVTIAGEFDYMHPYHLNYANNYAIVAENAEKGNYYIPPAYGWSDCIGTTSFNYSSDDPVRQEIFLNKNFRIALSHAINRQEINGTRFKGMYKMPSSPAPPDGPPYFGESEGFNRYAAYDSDKANRLLDEMGLKWDAKHEVRLRPDGKPLQLNAIVVQTWGYQVEVAEMYKKYWADVGVAITIKPLGSGLFSETASAMNYDIRIGPTNWGGRRPIIAAMRAAAVPISESWHVMPPWARWILSDGERGEEPPAPVKRLYQLHVDFMAEPDADKREAMETEIFKIHNDEFYLLTSIKQPADLLQVYYNPVHNRMGNVYAPVAPEWYYAQPSTWYAKWHED